MPVTLQSSRFGELEIAERDVIRFPLGLIGLAGSRYVFIDRNPDSGFRWLHSLEDAALALPVVDPRLFFPSFAPVLAAEDRERTGIDDLSSVQLYVTVRATPDPADVTVNLRAPLVIRGGRGYQVINTAPDAELRTRLFAAPLDRERAPADVA